jgi:DNA repair protein RadC
MRGRLLASEAALADYEILEMLLFLGIPRRDTKPLAKSLINDFGSLAGAIEADRGALERLGLPRRAIEALDMVVEAAAILAQPDAIGRKVIADLAALEAHLDVPERSAQPPGWSALLLNNRNQLLGEPAWDADVAPGVLSREMLRAALDQHATAAILVRNAGPAAARITEADQAVHAQVSRAASPLSVVVHDLVVLGRGAWVSLRQRGH